jgi:hypothetical protein
MVISWRGRVIIPEQPIAADWMAVASEKSPLSECAPAAASYCEKADAESRTSAWTCWLAARRARVTASALGAGCAGYEKGLGLGVGHDSCLV